MKKLMIIAAVALSTVCAEAATVSWKSGNLYVASSAKGGWDSSATTQLIGKQGVVAYVAAILINSDAYSSLASATQKDIWDSYGNKDITKIGDGYANAVQVQTTGSSNSATVQTASEGSTTYYAVLLATYHDTTFDKDFYIATTATTTTSATGAGSVSYAISTVGAAEGGGWQPVPEPTSGLLMLVGLAGLALKRKRT